MDFEESDSDTENTPPEIIEKAAIITLDLLPVASRHKYELTYNKFMEKLTGVR